jgi:hypothetical protein
MKRKPELEEVGSRRGKIRFTGRLQTNRCLFGPKGIIGPADDVWRGVTLPPSISENIDGGCRVSASGEEFTDEGWITRHVAGPLGRTEAVGQ